ncbi:hypothetical protein HAX54_053110 [Datura stramonium]|uniref:Uncharacterized protein n=1 Tax=Datura stramonium TaxID=4076 RepID=A0ABS8T0H7_DATST|nr:hypothetical protein [Datura stramonium]
MSNDQSSSFYISQNVSYHTSHNMKGFPYPTTQMPMLKILLLTQREPHNYKHQVMTRDGPMIYSEHLQASSTFATPSKLAPYLATNACIPLNPRLEPIYEIYLVLFYVSSSIEAII